MLKLLDPVFAIAFEKEPPLRPPVRTEVLRRLYVDLTNGTLARRFVTL